MIAGHFDILSRLELFSMEAQNSRETYETSILEGRVDYDNQGRPKIDITTIIRESFERTSPDNGPGDGEKVRGELKRRKRAIETKESNKEFRSQETKVDGN